MVVGTLTRKLRGLLFVTLNVALPWTQILSATMAMPGELAFITALPKTQKFSVGK